jgi:hypothetical protein
MRMYLRRSHLHRRRLSGKNIFGAQIIRNKNHDPETDQDKNGKRKIFLFAVKPGQENIKIQIKKDDYQHKTDKFSLKW